MATPRVLKKLGKLAAKYIFKLKDVDTVVHLLSRKPMMPPKYTVCTTVTLSMQQAMP